jgi:peptidoglycan/LPS O-acetylase OafA/YrhL
MRYRGLDFLRGIAIIGVLFRHLEIDAWIARPGGYGVDLFFVLSGFLVSGLLFSEYKRKGKIYPGRFLIRRGFKIYPSFYFFILATILVFAVFYNSYFPTSFILSEVFFLQSYLTPMWLHTWSLAVEEHFYILLVVLILITSTIKWIESRSKMIFLFSAIILTTMTLRFFYVQNVFSKDHEAFFYTHLRMDGLFTGALLGYLWHFNENFIQSFYRRRKLFALLIPVLIMPALVLKSDNTFMLTFGFNLFHAACAIAILLLLENEGERLAPGNKIISGLISAVCFIGVYSYSVYLWHLPVQNILTRYIEASYIESVLYISISLVVGIGLSWLIEKPMLKIRDRYFPRI